MEYPWNNDEVFVTYFSSKEVARGIRYAASNRVDLQNSKLRELADNTLKGIRFDKLKFDDAFAKALVEVKLKLTDHDEKAVKGALGMVLRERRTRKQRYKQKINK